MPTAPGIASTVRSKSSSFSTIFTVSLASFSLPMRALTSPGAAPNSFCAARRISGDSGSLITKVKFLPSGHVFNRKSTRLNSSHGYISYAVFCLKKKKKTKQKYTIKRRHIHQTSYHWPTLLPCTVSTYPSLLHPQPRLVHL